ncbi:YtpI family protein [Paenibacillus arenilitoris]|uniref:YtpI family protein n=1 Tax=Paenibacillus arenilitoris TaxID=2772299 RepID=A0A927CRP4_9BACL|nr:YtpI family protein [Paenibacillus arenilitoris]MBD2872909.1 YtpI family protein [Paenibacillus arenilitoris]
MDQLMQWLFAPAILVSLAFSAVFSFKARRSKDVKTRGMMAARMNISMGVMLLFIAGVQLFWSGESTLRIVIGAIFMVIGIFNLFAGLRNLSLYRAARDR